MEVQNLRVQHVRGDRGREVWTLAGEIDLLTIPLLNLALRSARAPHTVVDLTQVGFIDLAAARALVTATEQARSTGRRLSVVSPTSAVLRILTVTGLVARLEIHDTLADVFPPALSGHSGDVLAPTTEEETSWLTDRPRQTRRH